VAFPNLNGTISVSPDTNISALGGGNKLLKQNMLRKTKAARSCQREREKKEETRKLEVNELNGLQQFGGL